MKNVVRLSTAALAATLLSAAPAAAQQITFDVTGFFSGGAGCTGTTCTVNGSSLIYTAPATQNVSGSGNANFGTFQTSGTNQANFAGSTFTLRIMQTSPAAGMGEVVGSVTGTISSNAEGGSGGLTWTPTTSQWNIAGVDYRLFVDNFNMGVNIEPPKPNGELSDPQTIRGRVDAVPEPGTFLLVTSGLVGLVSAARRRRAQV